MECVRISGPFVSSSIPTTLPVFFDASLMDLIRALCSSCEPCEKLSRATFIPASINCSSSSGDSLAGPIVHTIFVFLITKRPFVLYSSNVFSLIKSTIPWITYTIPYPKYDLLVQIPLLNHSLPPYGFAYQWRLLHVLHPTLRLLSLRIGLR